MLQQHIQFLHVAATHTLSTRCNKTYTFHTLQQHTYTFHTLQQHTYTFHTLQQHIHFPHLATTHTLSTCYNNTYSFHTLQQDTQKQNPKLKYYLSYLFHIVWLLKNFFTSLFSVSHWNNWNHMFFRIVQSHWGFIYSRILFSTFSNLTAISKNTRILLVNINKRMEYENCFGKDKPAIVTTKYRDFS